MNATLEPINLSDAQKQAAREFCEHLKQRGALRDGELTAGEFHLKVPAGTLRVFAEAVQSLAEGQPVTVVSLDEEVSPQEAATLLRVSRPYAARLYDEGSIPSRRVGSHRRALLGDVLRYRDRERAARLKALDELAVEGQRLNL